MRKSTGFEGRERGNRTVPRKPEGVSQSNQLNSLKNPENKEKQILHMSE